MHKKCFLTVIKTTAKIEVVVTVMVKINLRLETRAQNHLRGRRKRRINHGKIMVVKMEVLMVKIKRNSQLQVLVVVKAVSSLRLIQLIKKTIQNHQRRKKVQLQG